MRIWPCLLLLAIAQPAWAGGDEAPYYGPAKRWHGIGYKLGYEDRIAKDGSWQIETAVRGRDEAIDMALYRAAERARDEGYRYVMLLGGRSVTSYGISSATLYARPSHEAVAPVGCRSRKATTCYTADVAEVLRILGGPDGTQPGVAIVDHRDEFGREVFLSGYGTGAIAALAAGRPGGSTMKTIDGRLVIIESAPAVPRGVMPAAPVAPVAAARVSPPPARPIEIVALSQVPAPQGSDRWTADENFRRTREANQPVRGRDARQGWTISD